MTTKDHNGLTQVSVDFFTWTGVEICVSKEGKTVKNSISCPKQDKIANCVYERFQFQGALHILRFQFEAYCLTTSFVFWIRSLWHVNTWLVETHKCPQINLCIPTEVDASWWIWYGMIRWLEPGSPPKKLPKSPWRPFFPLAQTPKSQNSTPTTRMFPQNPSTNTRATGSKEKNNSWLMLTPSQPGLPEPITGVLYFVADLGVLVFSAAYWKMVALTSRLTFRMREWSIKHQGSLVQTPSLRLMETPQFARGEFRSETCGTKEMEQSNGLE